MKRTQLRLYLIVMVVNRPFECILPSGRSLNDCIPYLNRLLEPELEHRYVFDEQTVFLEASSGLQISRTVTLNNQHLCDGMRIMVY